MTPETKAVIDDGIHELYGVLWVVLDSSPRPRAEMPQPTTIAEKLMLHLQRTRGAGHTSLMTDAFSQRTSDHYRSSDERLPLMVFASVGEADRVLRGGEVSMAHHYRSVTTPHDLEKHLLRNGPRPILVDNHVLMQMGEEMWYVRGGKPRPVGVFLSQDAALRWIHLQPGEAPQVALVDERPARPRDRRGVLGTVAAVVVRIS